MEEKEQIAEFEKELQALLQKYHIKVEPTIVFPIYKVLPVEVQLALVIIANHKGVYRFNYRLEK